MRKKITKYAGFFVLLLFVFFQNKSRAQAPSSTKEKADKISSTQVLNDSLPYKFRKNSNGSLFLNLPTLKEVVFDEDIKRYVVLEKIGTTVVKQPLFFSTTEYKERKLKNQKAILCIFNFLRINQYWKFLMS